MKNVNKLVALLLALTLIVGLMPGMTVHVHAEETEYPEIVLDTETIVNIEVSNETVYFTFTPETTHSYTFYADGTGNGPNGSLDTEGYLYDSEMNQLAYNGDISYANYNFSLSYTMEADKTYILGAKMYNQYLIGSFPVYLVMNHECEGTVTTPATCTEDGVMTYTCANCDYSYTEAIPAGHSYENGYCTGCGEEQVYTGECGYYGDNLTWTLTGSGKLTISGEGMMKEYHPYYTPTPWSQYASLIKTVEIEEGATTIGDYAFNGCTNLTEAVIPSTVNKISDSAFRDCAALTSVNLSEGLATIEGYAFKGCTGLTSLSIPDSVTIIGSNAFNGCYNITELDLGGVIDIGAFAFYNCTGLTEVIIPDSVTTMGSDVFHGCSNLAKVKISEGLTQIPDLAFTGTALTEVEIPAGVTQIGTSAFQNCTSLVDVTLHEGLLVIGSSAFQNTALVEVKAPSSIKSFNDNAFAYCTSLKKINIPDGMTYMLYGMFQGCTSLERVVIPASVRNIDGGVFNGCTSLKEVVFVGNMPEIMESFVGVVADVYYPADDASYTEDVMRDYGGDLTWHPLCPEDKHTWDTWAVTEEPTCTEAGEQVTYCLSCGVSKVEEIEALGHDHSDSHVVEPTCTEQGYTTHTCTRCLNQYTDSYVDATGHTYGEWVVTTAPTCTTEGVETRTCANCDAAENRTVAVTDHEYEGVVTAPTTTEKGYTTYTCVHCGDSYVADYVDPIPEETEPEETVPEETVPEETTPEETVPEETEPGKDEDTSKGPQTGDAASGIWLVLMVISLFGITALVTGKKWAVK